VNLHILRLISLLQTTSESKAQGKEKEVSDLKAKIVSMEAQLVEKVNKVTRIEKELKEAHKKLLENGSRGSSSTARSVSGIKAPGVDVAPQDAQPVLMSDPAGKIWNPNFINYTLFLTNQASGKYLCVSVAL